MTSDGTTVVNVNDHIDVSQLEGTLQTLLNKIEKLEMERNGLRDQLSRLLKKTDADKSAAITHTTRIHTIEDNLNDVEEGRERNLS